MKWEDFLFKPAKFFVTKTEKKWEAPNAALVSEVQVDHKQKDLVNLEFELNVLVHLKNTI